MKIFQLRKKISAEETKTVYIKRKQIEILQMKNTISELKIHWMDIKSKQI